MKDDEPMVNFLSEDWVRVSGRGWMAIVRCDIDRPRDKTGLEGQTVNIDGKEYVVRAVDRHLIIPPIKAGDRIGLLVDER
jgi:hypothetical protein